MTKLILLTSLLCVVGFISCQYKSNNLYGEIKNKDSESPYQVVTAFFQTTNSEFSERLERPYPDRFSECLFETPLDCSEKRKKNQQSKTSPSDVPRFEVLEKNNEVSLTVKNFSKKIASRSITLKRKVREWVIETEARVRVEIEINGITEVKDFLLFKDVNWQIFEIANENEHLYYATPSENNKISL